MQPESMSAFQQALDAIKTGGPWTLVLALSWVVRFLYLKREADKEKHDTEKQKLNDRLLGMAEKQNEVLEKATENQAAILEAMTGGKR